MRRRCTARRRASWRCPAASPSKMLDALRRPDHYRGVVEDVRRHLIAHHSYDQRVEELVAALDGLSRPCRQRSATP